MFRKDARAAEEPRPGASRGLPGNGVVRRPGLGGGARAQCAAFAPAWSNGRRRLILAEDGPNLRRGRGDAAGDAEAAVPEREGEDHGCPLSGVRRGNPLTSGGN